MKKQLIRLLAAFLFVTCPLSSFAAYEYCGVGYVVVAGYDTIYHHAQWYSYDAWDPFDWVYIHTELTYPFFAQANSSHEAGSGGEVIHHLIDPDDGEHSASGTLQIQNYSFYSCSVTGIINNVPDPVFTSPLTFSPNPAIVGDTVTANWSTQYATAGCTYNGNPVNTQGPLTFTAGMNHNGSYTILCAAAGQPSASESEDLVVWECDDEYIPNIGAPNSSPGTTSVPGQIPGVFGFTAIGWDFGSIHPGGLACSQVCVDHSWKYAISGNLVLSSTSHESVAGQVQAASCPGVLTRTSANKLITSIHENIHGEAGTAVINTYNLSIHSSVYPTSAACVVAANLLLDNLDGSLTAEMADQDANHPDHSGQPIQVVYCDSNQQTVEVSQGEYP